MLQQLQQPLARNLHRNLPVQDHSYKINPLLGLYEAAQGDGAR